MSFLLNYFTVTSKNSDARRFFVVVLRMEALCAFFAELFYSNK